MLRSLVRMAHSLKYLSLKAYEKWARQVDEIGRMAGGWIKAMQ